MTDIRPEIAAGEAITELLAGFIQELRSAGLRDAALGAQALKEARDGAGIRYDPKVVEAFAAVLESQGGTW